MDKFKAKIHQTIKASDHALHLNMLSIHDWNVPTTCLAYSVWILYEQFQDTGSTICVLEF